ncbi:MAG: 2-amino-4-hydroxy-6-hydroxymethyldihydropteridine diphosphokinase, partial [Planctomycetota bacterium]
MRRLVAGGVRLAAVAPAVWSAYERAPGEPDDAVPRVLNTVAEVHTDVDPGDLLARLHAVETEEGRDRDDETHRTLDLDLLEVEGVTQAGPPSLPHPRATARAFVLAPWEAVAPLHLVTGSGRTVLQHAAALRRRRPEAFRSLEGHGPIDLPPVEGACTVLEARGALAG